MENTFFDEELIKSKRLVLCPKCRTRFKVSLEEVEINCDCGEDFCADINVSFPEDFVWHPSERY